MDAKTHLAMAGCQGDGNGISGIFNNTYPCDGCYFFTQNEQLVQILKLFQVFIEILNSQC